MKLSALTFSFDEPKEGEKHPTLWKVTFMPLAGQEWTDETIYFIICMNCRKIFSGLTPSYPNAETAIELINKIKTESA